MGERNANCHWSPSGNIATSSPIAGSFIIQRDKEVDISSRFHNSLKLRTESDKPLKDIEHRRLRKIMSRDRFLIRYWMQWRHLVIRFPSLKAKDNAWEMFLKYSSALHQPLYFLHSLFRVANRRPANTVLLKPFLTPAKLCTGLYLGTSDRHWWNYSSSYPSCAELVKALLMTSKCYYRKNSETFCSIHGCSLGYLLCSLPCFALMVDFTIGNHLRHNRTVNQV